MIAMGMLVDNAIVVAEGMVTGVEEGKTPEDAAAFAVGRTAYPLLGATVIGLLAFAPIGLSAGDTAVPEHPVLDRRRCRSVLSWLTRGDRSYPCSARCCWQSGLAPSSWGRPPAGAYRRPAAAAPRRRWRAREAACAAPFRAATIYAFGHVKQSFFPRTNSPLFHIDYLLPKARI